MSRRMDKRQRKGTHVSMLLMAAGSCLVLIAGGYWYGRLSQVVLAEELVAEYVSSHKTSAIRPALPEQIIIRDQTLSVEPKPYEEGTWVVSEEAVSFLLQSARPGEVGNSIFYGHNKSHIFRILYDVEQGDEVMILRADGTKRRYRVSEVHRVAKNETELLAPTTEEVLTLYTCIGWMDSERLVVRAEPVSD
jgi:LPXTG-site transpeptidase (sortase) family protein